jgi:hypothetical protein
MLPGTIVPILLELPPALLINCQLRTATGDQSGHVAGWGQCGERKWRRMFTAFTASGPIVGGIGYFIEQPWLFWIGTALAGMNLFMNMASGVMKLPILPLAFMFATAGFVTPWYVGLSVGLLVWTAVEASGEIFHRLSQRS